MTICLVVDDEALHREIDCFALNTAGFTTREASSAEQALAICEEEMPDVILLDLMMPGKNGLEFISCLRQLSHGTQPFILVCSAYGVGEIEETVKTAGADDFLLKPFSSTKLKEKLSERGVISPSLFSESLTSPIGSLNG